MTDRAHYPVALNAQHIGFSFSLFGRQAKPLLQCLSVDALVVALFLARAG